MKCVYDVVSGSSSEPWEFERDSLFIQKLIIKIEDEKRQLNLWSGINTLDLFNQKRFL